MKLTAILSLVAAAVASASAIPGQTLEKRFAGFPYECENLCIIGGVIHGTGFGPSPCPGVPLPSKWFECPTIHAMIVKNGPCTFTGGSAARSIDSVMEDIIKRSPEPQLPSGTWTCPRDCAQAFCRWASFYPTGSPDPAQYAACLEEQACVAPA